MKAQIRLIVACVLGAAMLAACAPTKRVTREKAGSGDELSGNWSAVDAKETAAAFIKDCFAAPWLQRFSDENGRPPAVRVDRVVNKTDEKIDAQVFIKELEKAMVNSGQVEVLAQRGAELSSAREEQDDSISGRVDGGVGVGGEMGGDFVLTVHMTSILDQADGEKVKYYRLNATLIAAGKGNKVWVGDHEIQKRMQQAKASW